MKKLYSFCFVFLMLICISMNAAQAQEIKFVTDIGEISGIYKTEDGNGVAYVYPVEGNGVLNIRELYWDDPNTVGLTPADYDNAITPIVGMTDDGVFYTEIEGLEDTISSDERYCFSRANGTIELQQQIPAASPFYKIADLYTQGEIEGPYEGIFCGMIDGEDSVFLCIGDGLPNKGNCFADNTTIDPSLLKEGTPVRYSTQKKSFFDPATLTSHSDIVIVDIQPKE